jgi:hypothetical protein
MGRRVIIEKSEAELEAFLFNDLQQDESILAENIAVNEGLESQADSEIAAITDEQNDFEAIPDDQVKFLFSLLLLIWRVFSCLSLIVVP